MSRSDASAAHTYNYTGLPKHAAQEKFFLYQILVISSANTSLCTSLFKLNPHSHI